MKNQVFTKRKLSQVITQYSLITLLVLALGGYFGYQHYTEYQASRAALDKESRILTELKASADVAKTTYHALKKDMDAQNAGVNQSIEKILPSNENFTDLARELDKYFLNTRATNSPLFLSNLTFSSPNTQGAEFAILPLSMSMSGDEQGLIAFLEYVENSGDLNAKTRLLDFSSINLSYSTTESTTGLTEYVDTVANILNPVRTINASLNLRAYFQKPIDVNPTI